MRKYLYSIILAGLFANCISAETLYAQDDYIQVAHNTSGVVLPNILINDYLGSSYGYPLDAPAVTITVVSSSPYIALQGTSVITTFPAASVDGYYSIVYQICLNSEPGTCATATVHVKIGGEPIPVQPYIIMYYGSDCGNGTETLRFDNIPATWICQSILDGTYYRQGTSSFPMHFVYAAQGGHYAMRFIDPATGRQSPPVERTIPMSYVADPCAVELTMSPTYSDYNGNGIVDAGDRIMYSYTVTNHLAPGYDLSHMSIFTYAPFALQITSNVPATLYYETPDTTSFAAYHTISDADITNGFVNEVTNFFADHGLNSFETAANAFYDFGFTNPSAATLSGGGNTCNPADLNISVAVTGGIGPYTVIYTDGTDTFTRLGYVSGTPIPVHPIGPTTYTLISVTDAGKRVGTGLSGAASFVSTNQFSFYTDADSDGYGSGDATILCAANAATPPAGYAVSGNDCDDTTSAVNPANPEILYNGIDDNCDGQLDEGSPITTTLEPSACNSYLTSMTSSIAIAVPAPASAYTGFRIRVTNGPHVQTIDKTVPYFSLMELPVYSFGTGYTVEVELQRNGIWLGYFGPACQINSPESRSAAGSAHILPAQCGTTLASLSSHITSTSLSGTSQYRFRVTNVTAGATGSHVVQTIDRSTNWFSLPMLAEFGYGKTYMIEVAIRSAAGDFGNYGTPCFVSSPVIAPRGAMETLKTTTINGGTFPNPFTTSFAVNVELSAKMPVDLRVYDMVGKLVESRSVTASDLSSLALGEAYAAGEYIVILSQGDTVTKLKVIKR